MDPIYPLVTIANFICFFLVLVPFLTANLRTNVGVCMYAFWVALACLIRAVNCIIWSDNADDSAPIWCDIVTRLGLGSSVGVAACSLVITRRLYLITRMKSSVSRSHAKRLENVVDLLLCLGIPTFVMAIYYVVQESRYQILEELGCVDGEVASGLTLILVTLWNVVLPTISVLFYCPGILWVFYRQRRDVKEPFANSSHISQASYLRFMALGCIDALVTLPLNVLGLVVSLSEGPIPFWPGFKAVHSQWDEIPQLRTSDWAPMFWVNFSVRRSEWLYVAYALVFFLLFGLTKEIWTRYRQLLCSILGRLGIKMESSSQNEEVTAIDFRASVSNDQMTAGSSSHLSVGSSNNSGDPETFGKAPNYDEDKGNSVLILV